MADQDRNRDELRGDDLRDDLRSDRARDASGNRGSRPNTSGSNRDRDLSSSSDSDAMGEPDDVAEDRNLSGSSTWLNLPDQPDADSDSSDRDEDEDVSNR